MFEQRAFDFGSYYVRGLTDRSLLFYEAISVVYYFLNGKPLKIYFSKRINTRVYIFSMKQRLVCHYPVLVQNTTLVSKLVLPFGAMDFPYNI
jgi:hypothetical protein